VSRGSASQPSCASCSRRSPPAAGPSCTVGSTRWGPAFDDLGPGEPPSASSESGDRFIRGFRRLVRAFARRARPLVLFLDDLQWADFGSLQLLEGLCADPRPNHLLVVGTCRPDALRPGEPVAEMLANLDFKGAPVEVVELKPLSADEVAAFLEEALWCATDRARRLAESVVADTGGNPWAMRRMLEDLHRAGSLRFDAARGGWIWPEELWRERGGSDPEALARAALGRVSEETVALLGIAAALGERFSLDRLSIAAGRDRQLAAAAVMEAIEAGLLLPEGSADTLLTGARSEEELARSGAEVRFAEYHTRLTAMERVPEAAHAEARSRLGEHLLARLDPEVPDDRLFEAVDHLNRAYEVLGDTPVGRTRLVRLNLRCARRARASGADRSANDSLRAALRCAPAEAWETAGPLMVSLHREAAEVAFLVRAGDEAERLLGVALERDLDPLARSALHRVRIVQRTVEGQLDEAVAWALRALDEVGVELSRDPREASARIEADVAAVRAALEAAPPGALIVGEAEAAEPAILAAQELLETLAATARYSDEPLFWQATARATRLAVEHGPTRHSAYPCAQFGALLAGGYDTPEAADMGRLAIRLAERFDEPAIRSRVVTAYVTHMHHWRAPLRGAAEMARDAITLALEAGELQFAGQLHGALPLLLFAQGVRLEQVEEAADRALAYRSQRGGQFVLELGRVQRQLVRALRGRTASPGSLDDARFSEERALREMPDVVPGRWYLHLARLRTGYLFGDLQRALAAADAAGPGMKVRAGHVARVDFVLYDALTRAAACLRADEPGRRSAYLARIDEHLAQLRRWADACPTNFAHKHALVAAERARLSGDVQAALDHFDAAVAGAHEGRFVHDEALALERLGDLLLEAGMQQLGVLTLRAAAEAYGRWGAEGVAERLRRRLLPYGEPALPAEAPLPPMDPGASLSASIEWGGQSGQVSALDMMTVWKAGQAISGETELEPLLATIARLVVESAGAQRGVLVLVEDDQLVVRATASVEHAASSVAPEPAARSPRVAAGVLRYVQRTGRTLVLADAARDHAFGQEPRFRERGTRSMLCVPILQHTRLVGLLYLENDLAPDVFTHDRVAVVTMLAGQMAIALQNSLLLERLKRENDERRRAESELQILNSQLEARVRGRTDDLLRTNADLRQFNQVVSHDLREPVRTMFNYASLLDRRFGEGLPTQAQEMLGQVRDGAERIQRLVTDLDRYARAGADEGEPVEVEVEAAIDDAIANLALAVQESEAEVRCGPMPRVRIDPTRLVQVFQNLLSNALRYRSDAPPRIVVEAEDRDGEWVFCVSDNGVGIPEDQRRAVFEVFRRLEPARRSGTGLGLALVERYVTRAGGRVWIAEPRTGGTTVCFSLPRADVDPG
jgi:signal transduction histidine kinase/predicted ATPase